MRKLVIALNLIKKIFRFGRTIEYNQYSQRSPKITLKKPQGKLRILMIGDSVLNGGLPINQDQTITSLLTQKIIKVGYNVEVLNASSGSWGIGNELAYLRKFGTFESDALILQIGTHDLIQPTSTSEKVGNDPHFPDQRPISAIQEVWERYGKRRVNFWFRDNLNMDVRRYIRDLQSTPKLNPSVDLPKNMNYLREIISFARQKNIPIYILFTPYRDDMIPKPKTPNFYPNFMTVIVEENIPIIDSYNHWRVLPSSVVGSYFRDSVHFTKLGNEAIADLIYNQLCLEGKLFDCYLK